MKKTYKQEIKKQKMINALFSGGYKGANDENLLDWAFAPLNNNHILRTDLPKLRSRSRDLARNDDTFRRFLSLDIQNVLGHKGIRLQAKNRLRKGQQDKNWNKQIETEWLDFCKKRRRRGPQSPTVCGTMSMREFRKLCRVCKLIDGEAIIQIMRGYPHNRHRFALRLLDPDLLEVGYCQERKNGKPRIDMGIEFDDFDRPIAYHFRKNLNKRINQHDYIRIPADQIIHNFKRDFVGQIRGVPVAAGVLHKVKMLGGIDEAIVVGWRVAAAKLGFFRASGEGAEFDSGEYDEWENEMLDATPGSHEKLPKGVDFIPVDYNYPTSTYEMGHKVFMQQIANGLNTSSPTLRNDYSDVNYSSLRQASLEDREGWRTSQYEEIDGIDQPIFDEWYDWSVNVTGRISIPESKRSLEPNIEWQPRGWSWVDPLKEVNAQEKAVANYFRTRQSVLAETTGSDFTETIQTLGEEREMIDGAGLSDELFGANKKNTYTIESNVKEYETDEDGE